MSANPWSGEVELVIDGTPHTLKLTLGALAALEAELGTDSLMALVNRFESGGFAARDVLALLQAGLRGAGHAAEAARLAQAEIAGGPLGAAQAAMRLLVRAFALPDGGAGMGSGDGGL